MLHALLLAFALTQETQPAPSPQAEQHTAQELRTAGGVIGVELTEEEAQLALRDVVENLESYRRLRGVALDNSVAPVLTFSPTLQWIAARHPRASPFHGAARSLPGPKRPERLEELAYADIPTLAALIRSKQVSCLELTEMYLARLQRLDSKLACVVTLLPDRARQQAMALDGELAEGDWRGLLHGIPWGAKDLLAVKGAPTTWGAEPYRDQVLDVDATVVELLDQAGAVLLAKLSLGALAMGDVWYGGTTKNPWKTDQGSSGSSAGPAAAVAAGCVAFAIGSETCGSILSPASRCGASALRPTFGRVSRHGAMALSWSMDKLGPLCRTLDDTAIVLSAIAGPDPADEETVTRAFSDPGPAEVRGLRVGYVEKSFGGDEDEVELLTSLEQLGCELVPVEVPTAGAGDLFFVLSAEAAAAFDELTRTGRDDLLGRQTADAWPNIFRASRLIPAVEYIQANRARRALIEQVEGLFDTIDVLVHPTREHLVAFNLTGHPSACAPWKLREDGTPRSVAFTAGLYQESRLLAVASAWQRAGNYHKVHPDL
jgi:Asp-tRNA(Asn)/Glu-tRNA(Gln) amidotransferase A subunit family amidase